MLFCVLINWMSVSELEQIECSQNRNCANLHVGGHEVARPRRSRQRKSKHSDTDQQSPRSRIWLALPKNLEDRINYCQRDRRDDIPVDQSQACGDGSHFNTLFQDASYTYHSHGWGYTYRP